jgi:hypothetical protein
MENAYVLEGELTNHDTIKLREPVPFDDGKIKVTIELEKETMIKRKPRKELYGLWKDKIKMSPDFDEPLDCFKEYMK